jgi:hypothetical protein
MTDTPGTPRILRPTSAKASAQGDGINSNDTRIMLHMLLTEARRYHAEEARQSKRRPSASTSARSSPNASLSDSTHYLDNSWCVVEPGGSDSASMRDDTSSPDCSPPESVANSSEGGYDPWADLQVQIEAAWSGPGEVSSHARYNRIKSYLTWMFIWDPSRDWSEFEDVSAQASLDWITHRQIARLNELRPGQLFIGGTTSEGSRPDA